MYVQIGEAYLEEISREQENGVFITRVIRPIKNDMMVRFDVVIVQQKYAIEIVNIMFYKKGDKEREKKALEGDRA